MIKAAGPLSPKQPRAYRHVDDYNNSSRKNVFQPYISPEAAQQGIREGSLYQGIIRLTKNRNDAYVIPDDLDADVYISGLTGRNRSLHGDNVVVRLLDVETVWNERQEREAQRRKERAQKKHNEKVEAAAELDDNIDSTIESLVEEEVDVEQLEEGHKPTYCGEVVSILERSPNFTFAGTITATRFANTALLDNNRPLRVAWFKPNDLRVPFLVLRNKDIPDDLLQNPDIYRNTLFSATISHWPINDPFPTGTIIREIGPLGDLLTEKEAILADNSIIRTEFSSVALRGLPDLPWCIPESEIEKRRDLRNERIFSIDPSTAKDLDDALHIKELADGFYEVGVHIADVGYFLKRGSPLDTEAYERGTSTYLVDSVIPMLPSILCEELCSLNPGVDRLAFSVIWKMDFEGKIVDTWFGKTVIRSCAKLAYEDAQCVIDGQEMSGDIVMHDSHLLRLVSGDIFMLNSLATGMRRRRFQSGSLTLNSVKLMFELDLQGRPTSVKKFESKDANHLVEEFMLCANISVAKKIASVYPQASLLRKHEPPLERRLNKFLDLTEELGLDFAGNTAGELQRSFDKIKNKDVKDVLLVLAIRCMQRAKYFSSGSADSSKYLHYALNEKMYTHFTSPIRRYADVIVHRILEAALENNSKFLARRIVQKMTFKCNSKKDAAKNAQDTNIGLYLAKYLSNYQETKGPVYTKADVIYVGKETYEVYVPLYGLEKKFHVEDLPTEQHYYDKETHKLDIFWKAGVPVTMHNEEKMYAQRRILKDDYSDDDLDVDIPIESLTLKDVDDMVENDDLLVPPVVLEENTCLQRLGMFSRITVRIQVNDERSPPIINVYPVNPFSGESVVEIN
ncbi:uncharacterized protein EV154DRAFT_413823 [Mucor mucedo]|uniref:uncharacterized protein n=1 Tax=Mucor mucedo TaxID=29922 RepID=UPI00222031D7|nr:uncharacterized protein EV154DRAFT_413823 [Mucor mucedo]KAI7895142.1 hypothetical protein EV154DRAFT_413823 [Mucor mucedo]